jgi:two-component system chemotaxis response regulator CheB
VRRSPPRDEAPSPARWSGDGIPPAGRVALVILAASAGGLDAISQLLSELPGDFPAAVAVVLHRATRHQADPLREILHARTALRVTLADTGAAIRPATVYIAPPDSHLRIDAEQRFVSQPGPAFRHVKSSADPLLISAAEAFGPRLVAVILTGKGRDGALGAAAVSYAGGIVLAQEPATASAAGMPEAAIATGAVHSVLPLERIAARLIALAAPR